MWELDYKESWALKNWSFFTVVLEKTLESPLGYKEIKWINPKGSQSWIFTGRTEAEAETPIVWPPDAKDLILGKTEGRRRRGQQSMRWLKAFSRAGDGQGNLACCSPLGLKESDTTEHLNWTEKFRKWGHRISVFTKKPKCFGTLKSRGWWSYLFDDHSHQRHVELTNSRNIY